MCLNGFTAGFPVFQLFDQSVFFYPTFRTRWEREHANESLSAWLSKCRGLSKERCKLGRSSGCEHCCPLTGAHTCIHAALRLSRQSAHVSRVNARSLPKGICHSLIAQLVKNPPAMQETPVRFLGWEDPPGKGKGYPLQYSGLENSMDCIVHGVVKSWTWLNNFHSHFSFWR